VSAELILETAETSVLIIEVRPRSDIVIGVPHHAPAGQVTLPCCQHRDADENAGFLGRYLAEKLGCCSVIACNYTVDVNKCLRTDYSMQIAAWNPEQLVEIHGHGGTKAFSNIEISSGCAHKDEYSKHLAEKVRTAFESDPDLRTLTVCGEYDKLCFKAKQAVTISDTRWLSYHIELPPQLRKPPGATYGKPPEIAYRFCDILAQALLELHGT
jgi:hypothetical protein